MRNQKSRVIIITGLSVAAVVCWMNSWSVVSVEGNNYASMLRLKGRICEAYIRTGELDLTVAVEFQDGWGGEFRAQADATQPDLVSITSNGPDGLSGTADDVVAAFRVRRDPTPGEEISWETCPVTSQ